MSALRFPLSLAGLPLVFYLPALYARDAGLPLAIVGMVFMAVRAGDLVIDPLVGQLSDRTRGRFGRRAPWIVAGVLLMTLVAWPLFTPGPHVGVASLSVLLTLFYVGWTLAIVPYYAAASEASSDYYERSRIMGYREAVGILGLLVASALPVGLAQFATGVWSIRETVRSLAILLTASLPLCAAISLLALRDRQVVQAAPGARLFPSVRGLGRNKPLILLVLAAVSAGLGGAAANAVGVLFFEGVVGPGTTEPLVLVYMAASLAGAPVWMLLTRRFSKHATYCMATMWAALSLLAFAFIPAGCVVAFSFAMACLGFAYAGPAIVGAAMLADVVDLDTVRSRTQRAALFVAIFAMVEKLVGAAGAGLTLTLLDRLGIDATRPETGAEILRAFHSWVPAGLFLISSAIISRYPITSARQAVIGRILDRRRRAPRAA